MATIDERLDRLTERHEALVQYTELTAHENQARFSTIASQLDKVAETIAALAQIAQSHERRIDRLESQ
jgi:hypothetical protein